MEASLLQLERQLTVTANIPNKPENDKFTHVMGPFAKSAREQYELLLGMYNKMEKSYNDLATYFCFDPVKIPIEEFFGDVQKFIAEFRKAYDDNLRVKEAEEKARQAQLNHERALRDKQTKIQKRYAAELSGGKGECDFSWFFVNADLFCRGRPRRSDGQSAGSTKNGKCVQKWPDTKKDATKSR